MATEFTIRCTGGAFESNLRNFGKRRETKAVRRRRTRLCVFPHLWRPDITPASRFEIDGTTYEVLGTPENIGMRNQYLVAKVRAVKGGA